MDDIDTELSREERKKEPRALVTILGCLSNLEFALTLDFPFNETIFVLMV